MKHNFFFAEMIPKNISRGVFFMQKFNILQNKLAIQTPNIRARVTKLIARDEVTRFDGIECRCRGLPAFTNQTAAKT